MPETLNDWAALITIFGGPLTILSILVSLGFFVRRNRTLKDLLYVEQERDDFRRKWAKAETRLDAIDPQRFMTRAETLTTAGNFSDLAKTAFAFTDAQSQAFGRAAEILADDRILASGAYGKPAADEALRFIDIGLAADPGSKRLQDLRKLAQSRAAAIDRGEPIETLAWDGLTATELNQIALDLLVAGKYSLAEIAARRSVPLAILQDGIESRIVCNCMSLHGSTLNALGEHSAAESIHRHVLKIDPIAIGITDSDYAVHLNNLALSLVSLGKGREAEEFSRKALALDEQTIGPLDKKYANHLNCLALSLCEQGKWADAEVVCQRVMDIDEKIGGTEDFEHARHLNNLALMVSHQGRWPEAERLYRNARELNAKTVGKEHPEYANVLSNLAFVVQNQGHFPEAEDLYRQAMEIDAKTIGTAHPAHATHLNNLAGVVRDQGRFPEAEGLFRQATAIRREKLGDAHRNTKQVAENFLALLETHNPSATDIPTLRALLKTWVGAIPIPQTLPPG